jgi:hypothetical protein
MRAPDPKEKQHPDTPLWQTICLASLEILAALCVVSFFLALSFITFLSGGMGQ